MSGMVDRYASVTQSQVSTAQLAWPIWQPFQLKGMVAPLGWFLSTVLVFVTALGTPFSDPDVLIYGEIGRAIYERGLLPYEWAFDHKPVVAYYIYGLAAVLLPLHWPQFQILCLLVFLLIAYLIRDLVARGSYGLHLFLISVLSFKFLKFSGNTEAVFLLFALASFWALIRMSNRVGLVASGLLAACAFHVNYLACFLIGPAALFLLATREPGGEWKGFLRRLGLYVTGFLLGWVLVFLPFLFKNPSLITSYFVAQMGFLSGYQSSFDFTQSTKFLSYLLPLLLLLWVCRHPAPGFERLHRMGWIAWISALIGTLLSVRFYPHYAFPLAVLAVFLWLVSEHPRRKVFMVVTVAILALSPIKYGVGMLTSIPEIGRAYDFSPYEQVKAMVGEDPVLAVRASHIPFYYARIVPSQPMIWSDHAAIRYREAEDEYYLSYLNRQPPWVMMTRGRCEGEYEMRMPETCRQLRRDYQRVLTLDEKYHDQIELYRMAIPIPMMAEDL